MAVAFIVIGTVWLIFRKWIARQQYRIIMQMLGRNQQIDEGRIGAFETIGILFSVLLLLAGGTILILNLAFQP